ncbi:MAG TPA: hypothetical protein DCO75_10820 [Fibrobacteres bacterium]|nr:hypothetical protein [Fibrobacterota bacterium]
MYLSYKLMLRISLYLFPFAALISLYCSSNPQNPYTNPKNVTISLLLPDSTQTVYDRDTVSIKIIAKLPSLIDSIVLTADTLNDTTIHSVQDSIPLILMFNDTGSVAITATAYCKNSITKNCREILHIHKNPLVPPDTVFTKALSDTEIFLYWKKISVAKKYIVYRSISADTTAFSLINTITDTVYTDIDLTASTTYYYRILSIDSLNRKSGMSAIFKEATSAVPLSKWDEIIWDRFNWE